jgi:molybdenum cofactor cytidylyltransferase
MRFGPVPLAEAEGAILAHSIAAGPTRLRKGRILAAADLAALAEAGIACVTVARLEPGDLAEDAAAAALARALAPDPAALGLAVSAPFTGRVNLLAAAAGVVRIDAAAVAASTPSTPPSRSRPCPTTPASRRARWSPPSRSSPTASPAPASTKPPPLAPPIRLHPFRPGRASIILTRTPGMKPRLIDKGADALRTRLAALGLEADPPAIVDHDTAAVARAIAARAATPS